MAADDDKCASINAEMKIVGTLIGEALAARGLAQNSFHNPLLVARRMIASRLQTARCQQPRSISLEN